MSIIIFDDAFFEIYLHFLVDIGCAKTLSEGIVNYYMKVKDCENKNEARIFSFIVHRTVAGRDWGFIPFYNRNNFL